MKELKPCPFCGGNAEITYSSWDYEHHVGCEECPAWMEGFINAKEATKAWNTRHAT